MKQKKQTEDIIKAIENCTRVLKRDCMHCPYRNPSKGCVDRLLTDARRYLLGYQAKERLDKDGR